MGSCRIVAKFLTIVMRSIFCAGAVALAVLLPTAASAHPPGTPVSRPAPPARSTSSASHGAQQDFKVPFDVHVAPRPLSETVHSAFQQMGPQTTFNPFKWRGSISNPAYLWYQPGWYGPACAANTLWTPFGTPSANAEKLQNGQSQFGTKIGSLVDGKGILSTYGSEGAKNAAGIASSAANAPAAGGVTLQIGLPAACGIPNFTSWPI